MASQHRIQCINKSDRTSAHDRITHVGGINGDGTPWKLTQEDAIKKIEDYVHEFYVLVNNSSGLNHLN